MYKSCNTHTMMNKSLILFIFALYQLLEDNSFLERSYNTIRGKSKWLDDEKMEKFLNFPIPKKIVEAWEKVQS